MKTPRLPLVLLLALFCTGCSAIGRFYPIQGPLAAQTPPPVFVGKFTAHPPHLTVTVTLNNGESASGTLLRVFPAPKGPLPPTIPMSSQWDSVFGQGSYVATVVGQGQDARGVVTGTNGTILNVELHTGTPATGTGNLSPLQGVAQDNKGNIYKIAF